MKPTAASPVGPKDAVPLAPPPRGGRASVRPRRDPRRPRPRRRRARRSPAARHAAGAARPAAPGAPPRGPRPPRHAAGAARAVAPGARRDRAPRRRRRHAAVAAPGVGRRAPRVAARLPAARVALLRHHDQPLRRPRRRPRRPGRPRRLRAAARRPRRRARAAGRQPARRGRDLRRPGPRRRRRGRRLHAPAVGRGAHGRAPARRRAARHRRAHGRRDDLPPALRALDGARVVPRRIAHRSAAPPAEARSLMDARYRRAVPPVEHDRRDTHAPTRVRAADPPPSSSASGGISVGNLAIASASSVIAAVVVSHIWGAGTLFAAALTPVIVTLTSEALRRPQKVIKTVVETRTTSRFDPVAEGRRGVAEGDVPDGAVPPGTRAGERTVHRVDKRVAPVKRPIVAVALATGLVAFVIAGFLLTGSELVLGKSVGGNDSGTTLLGGG